MRACFCALHVFTRVHFYATLVLEAFLITIDNLCTHFTSIRICFSAQVKSGKMLSLCGHSGSGKSTVLRMIAGLQECEAGSVIIDGVDVTHAKPSARGVGMVFQQHALFPHYSVVDNVAYGLVSRGMPKKKARLCAGDFLESFGFNVTDTFLRQSVETLSGGEAQRVSLARTLITKPKVVLFDEPLSSLDPPLRKKLAQEICHLQKQNGFTGIFVTHDVEEAISVADEVAVLKQGAICWQGSAQDFSAQKLD